MCQRRQLQQLRSAVHRGLRWIGITGLRTTTWTRWASGSHSGHTESIHLRTTLHSSAYAIPRHHPAPCDASATAVRSAAQGGVFNRRRHGGRNSVQQDCRGDGPSRHEPSVWHLPYGLRDRRRLHIVRNGVCQWRSRPPTTCCCSSARCSTDITVGGSACRIAACHNGRIRSSASAGAGVASGRLL